MRSVTRLLGIRDKVFNILVKDSVSDSARDQNPEKANSVVIISRFSIYHT